MRNNIDNFTADQIFIHEDYNIRSLPRGEDLMKLYRSIIDERKIPLILDCGANVGYSSLYFSLTYQYAKIVAIEPELENLNAAQENAPNTVDFIHAAVGGKDRMGVIENISVNNNAFRILDTDDGDIKIYSIASILDRYDFKIFTPFIIKIDIEGYEDNLFSDNVDWIDEFPLLIIELHDWLLPRQLKSQNFLKAIALRDRDFLYRGENIFSVLNQR